MKPRIINIVTDSVTAGRIASVITRMLNLPVEVRSPGSMRRIVSCLSEVSPDIVLYTWSGDETTVLRWFKAQNIAPRDVRFMVLGYRGFGMADAFEINRMLAWSAEARPVAFAA
jgi:hypothetical protein